MLELKNMTDRYPIGTRVVVLSAYTMDRGYVNDGHEGEWFVVEECLAPDLALARSPRAAFAQLYVHVQRIEGSKESEARRGKLSERSA